jgi:hypothetical protein
MTAPTNGGGWVFWNPDSGEEYAPNHPIKSGEAPDAERIRRSTAQEDVLWQAFQAEAERAHALSKPISDSLEEIAALIARGVMSDSLGHPVEECSADSMGAQMIREGIRRYAASMPSTDQERLVTELVEALEDARNNGFGEEFFRRHVDELLTRARQNGSEEA